MYNGWTRETPHEQKLQNEVESARAYRDEHPCSEYWQTRLDCAEAELLEWYGKESIGAALLDEFVLRQRVEA